MQGLRVVSYEGLERPERTNVIVRRRQIGEASSDIGFAKKADGTFRAILSEYERSI